MFKVNKDKLNALINTIRMYLIIVGSIILCVIGLGIYMLVTIRVMKNHETYLINDGVIIVGETKADYKPWIIKETEVDETEAEDNDSDVRPGDASYEEDKE